MTKERMINGSKEDSIMTKFQLELRPYSRQEIADVLGVDINDSKHFKRNVINTLTKWGYDFEYSKNWINIKRKPTSAPEKLSEIMIRLYDLDVQLDTYAFSCFFYLLVLSPEFASMPWAERSEMIMREFGIEVSERTLRTWGNKLINAGTFVKDNEKRSRWVTGYYMGEKYRLLASSDSHIEEQVNRYTQEMSELLRKDKTWSEIFSTLWNKYHFCVYYAKGLTLSAWDNNADYDTINYILGLVNEIAEMEPYDTVISITQEFKNVS